MSEEHGKKVCHFLIQGKKWDRLLCEWCTYPATHYPGTVQI